MSLLHRIETVMYAVYAKLLLGGMSMLKGPLLQLKSLGAIRKVQEAIVIGVCRVIQFHLHFVFGA